MKKLLNKKNVQLLGYISVLSVLTLMPELVLAAPATTTDATTGLGGMAGKAEAQLSSFTKLITTIAGVAGIGFILAGLLGFKAHKESPQQYPLSKAIVLLAVGAALSAISVIQSKTKETIGLTEAHNTVVPYTTEYTV